MWKKSLSRGICSYCISVTLTILTYLIIVLCGTKQVCTPAFAERVGNPLTAVFLQTLLIGLIGFAFGAGSVLFEIERWSFLKQGAIHFASTLAVWIVVHLICFSPVTQPAVISFAASSAATYAITWGIQYFVWRAQVKKLNEQIQRKNEENPS